MTEAGHPEHGGVTELEGTGAGAPGQPAAPKPAPAGRPAADPKDPSADLGEGESETSGSRSRGEPEAASALPSSEEAVVPASDGAQRPCAEGQAGGNGTVSLIGAAPSAESGGDGPLRPAEAGSSQAAGVSSLSPDEPSQSAAARPALARTDPGNTFYLVKWISWKNEKTPLITQSENGPCPLIAIINVLLLRWKVKLPPQMEVISVEQLMTLLGDCVLSAKPKENSEGLQLNFEQNMNDAMAVLPKLSTGLDVNVRFTGVADFEYTPECIVFDLLDVPLYHGWLVDPQSCEMMQAVGRCSYNQLVEKIIFSKNSTDSTLVSEGLVAEQFLDTTATQLTYHGLCELTATAKEGELCAFFRNNHFSTMTKHKGHLYLLVTDQGFLSEQKVVWESLHNVEGDGNFCDSEFCLSHPSGRQLPYAVAQAPQQQIDQDYMVALSLQQQQQQGPGDISDLELAKKLQEEEDQQAVQYLQEQEHAAQPAPPARQAAGAARQGAGARRQATGEHRPQREEKTKDCAIL
ncbi:ubiquitin carboxyl-terminal hydrolase MINDY-1 isoform X2 [Heterodontus francisci]|uniref:ubiquitin carboxyl-terminal hydrolase MINDY-1 isoform X2 n=1 Tax=Heterodontus francisci TaxID=7792 RepID=UPI00355B7057